MPCGFTQWDFEFVNVQQIFGTECIQKVVAVVLLMILDDGMKILQWHDC